MTIIKKHIDTWFGSYVLMTTRLGHLVKVNFIYENNGMYEVSIYLATKPTNKFFKGWKRIGWNWVNEDNYPSIEEMLKTIATKYLKKEWEEDELCKKRNRKWEEFVKNA